MKEGKWDFVCAGCARKGFGAELHWRGREKFCPACAIRWDKLRQNEEPGVLSDAPGPPPNLDLVLDSRIENEMKRQAREVFDCSEEHIWIRYSSQPCPLCASHRRIRKLEKELVGVGDSRHHIHVRLEEAQEKLSEARRTRDQALGELHAREERIKELEQELEVAHGFHKVAVKERDLARHQLSKLGREE